ncbi:hypothetical protein [Brachybacterium sp. GPGPB12]|uniref:hypothetical protein n=1 Tax=Brachybacterium sp. GPGPB12 TaxID=3023517 RepID=UPI0031343E2F
MTLAGLLAFLGLAVVTMDVLGGVLAMGILLRGGTMRHLLAFAAGYVAVVVAATLVPHPPLTLLGRWSHPVLESNGAIGAVEAVVGLALIGFGVHQFRAASPPGPHGPLEERAAPKRLATVPLVLGGVAFAGTALADPAFTIAVGMASQEQRPHAADRAAGGVEPRLPAAAGDGDRRRRGRPPRADRGAGARGVRAAAPHAADGAGGGARPGRPRRAGRRRDRAAGRARAVSRAS